MRIETVTVPMSKGNEQTAQEWRIDGILWKFSVPITEGQAEQIVEQIRVYHHGVPA